MQITRGMRLKQAKEYVAQKLGVSLMDLSDPVVMLDVRKERGLGASTEAGEILYVDGAVWAPPPRPARSSTSTTPSGLRPSSTSPSCSTSRSTPSSASRR